MAGKLAKELEMDGSYWTKDEERIQAGYLEDNDDPGINRYSLDSEKGFVRAVRSLNERRFNAPFRCLVYKRSDARRGRPHTRFLPPLCRGGYLICGNQRKLTNAFLGGGTCDKSLRIPPFPFTGLTGGPRLGSRDWETIIR